MKYIVLLIALLVVASCKKQDTMQMKIDSFEKSLGKKKARILTEFVLEFENFIQSNTVSKNLDSAYFEFLNEIVKNPDFYKNIILDSIRYGQIIQKIKNDGLWDEVWVMKTDGTYDVNYYSTFYQSLKVASKNDSTIIKYLDAIHAAGRMSPGIITKGLLKTGLDPSNYFHKRILAIELFY